MNVVEILGDKMDVHMTAAGGTTVVARVDAHEQLAEQNQDKMHLNIDKIHFFEPGETGVNLCLNGVKAGV